MFYKESLSLLFIETWLLGCFVKLVTTSCKYRDRRYKVIVFNTADWQSQWFGTSEYEACIDGLPSREYLKIDNSRACILRTWTAGSVLQVPGFQILGRVRFSGNFRECHLDDVIA